MEHVPSPPPRGCIHFHLFSGPRDALHIIQTVAQVSALCLAPLEQGLRCTGREERYDLSPAGHSVCSAPKSTLHLLRSPMMLRGPSRVCSEARGSRWGRGSESPEDGEADTLLTVGRQGRGHQQVGGGGSKCREHILLQRWEQGASRLQDRRAGRHKTRAATGQTPCAGPALLHPPPVTAPHLPAQRLTSQTKATCPGRGPETWGAKSFPRIYHVGVEHRRP